MLGIMRLFSLALASVAAGLLIGLVGARADVGVRLNLRATDAFPGSTAADDPTVDPLAPDLPSQFPGYDLQSSSFSGTLLALGPAYSPYTLMANGDFASSTIALASDLHIHLAAAETPPDQVDLQLVSNLDQLQLSRSADGSNVLLAGAEWDFASWGGLGIAGSQVQPDSYLGGPVGFGLPTAKFSTMLGVSAHLNFGDGWVTSFSFDEGRAQLDLRPDALAVANGPQDDSVFSVNVAKDDIFGGDSLGLNLIRPVQESAYGLAANSNYSGLLGSQISLSSATPETDFQLDYETSFNGNITLQANAGYQMNVEGQNGTKAISVLSRAKINF
jgi:hypothetical protein